MSPIRVGTFKQAWSGSSSDYCLETITFYSTVLCMNRLYTQNQQNQQNTFPLFCVVCLVSIHPSSGQAFTLSLPLYCITLPKPSLQKAAVFFMQLVEVEHGNMGSWVQAKLTDTWPFLTQPNSFSHQIQFYSYQKSSDNDIYISACSVSLPIFPHDPLNDGKNGWADFTFRLDSSLKVWQFQ